MKRIQSVPLVIGQFLEAVDQNTGIVGSTTGMHQDMIYTEYTNLPLFLELYRYIYPLLSEFIDSSFCFLGSNYYVRILSTIDRELLKPSASVALHKHSNALVDVLPPEADSSITMLQAGMYYVAYFYIHFY